MALTDAQKRQALDSYREVYDETFFDLTWDQSTGNFVVGEHSDYRRLWNETPEGDPCNMWIDEATELLMLNGDTPREDINELWASMMAEADFSPAEIDEASEYCQDITTQEALS